MVFSLETQNTTQPKMPILGFTNTVAKLEYNGITDHDPISGTTWEYMLQQVTSLSNLIIEDTPQREYNITSNPSYIRLPSLHQLTFLTQLSIRRIAIYNGTLPPLPPYLLILQLYHTNIRIIDNLPEHLHQLDLTHNNELTTLILPPKLKVFVAIHQKKLPVLNIPPALVYLRLHYCGIERINRFNISSIRACIPDTSYITWCITPYPLLNNYTLRPTFTINPFRLFTQITEINRELDESFMSILYRLREYSYTHSTPPITASSPIIQAMSLASNPPRRFSEFILDY